MFAGWRRPHTVWLLTRTRYCVPTCECSSVLSIEIGWRGDLKFHSGFCNIQQLYLYLYATSLPTNTTNMFMDMLYYRSTSVQTQ